MYKKKVPTQKKKSQKSTSCYFYQFLKNQVNSKDIKTEQSD